MMRDPDAGLGGLHNQARQGRSPFVMTGQRASPLELIVFVALATIIGVFVLFI